MYRPKGIITLFVMAALAAISSCSTNDPGDRLDFDQVPMLENLSANVIIPAYETLVSDAIALDNFVMALVENPTPVGLEDARTALWRARFAWQACSFYQLGPAENNGLSSALNLYPVDENQVDRNIAEGSFNLETAANADARGFAALGYLLHGNTDENIIDQIENVPNYRNYLLAITDLILEKSEATLNGWMPDGGDYASTFNTSVGVSVASSVGQLVNAFMLDFERNIRDAKVGIPVGIRSLGVEIPENVEARYAGYSRDLLFESTEQFRNMYEGGEGVGFDDYLEELSAISTDNEDLSDAISQQFNDIRSAIILVPNPLMTAITDDKESVQNVFVEMQELVVLMKTDMASQIGVAITFQDSDGD